MIQKSSWIAGSHITVHSFSAELQPTQESPTLVITANLHGDECTVLVLFIKSWKISTPFLHHGTLVLYPSLNPDGFTLYDETLPRGKS